MFTCLAISVTVAVGIEAFWGKRSDFALFPKDACDAIERDRTHVGALISTGASWQAWKDVCTVGFCVAFRDALAVATLLVTQVGAYFSSFLPGKTNCGWAGGIDQLAGSSVRQHEAARTRVIINSCALRAIILRDFAGAEVR